jgi:DNA-binding response OmpR family regulator
MKKRILIVDDNPAIIFSVKNGLEEEYDEFDVIGVEGGEKCFDFLSKEVKPDLILLDIMMPDINGWDVYATLQEKEEWKDIPIVFLTAKTDDYSKGFGKLVCDDYIEKPFSIEDLKNRIDAVLQKEKK